MVVTHAKGTGKACPEHLEKELRDCVKECPAGASNPSEDGSGGGAGDAPEGGEGKEPEELETPEAVVEETHCSVEEEVWTPCSADCLQERFMGESCDKEAEVRLLIFRKSQSYSVMMKGSAVGGDVNFPLACLSPFDTLFADVLYCV